MALKFDKMSPIDPGSQNSEDVRPLVDPDVARGKVIVGGVKNFISDRVDTTADMFKSAGNETADSLRDSYDAAKAKGQEIGGNIREGADRIGEAAKSKGNELISGAKEFFKNTRERIQGGISKGFDWIKGTTNKIASIPDKVSTFAYKSIGASERVGKAAVEGATAKGQELWKRAGEAKDKFTGNVRQAYDTAAGTLKSGAEKAQVAMAEKQISNRYAPQLQTIMNELRLIQSGTRLAQRRAELDHGLAHAKTGEERTSAADAISSFEKGWTQIASNKTEELNEQYNKLLARRDQLALRYQKRRQYEQTNHAEKAPAADQEQPVIAPEVQQAAA